MRTSFLHWVAAALLGTALYAPLAMSQGAAQNYPDRPVRFLVGYSPGGLPDTVARIVAQKLSEKWKQQVVVENRPGANSNIAADAVAKAAPDGYTLFVSDNSTVAINPFIYAKMPFDAEKDLIPVAMVARAPLFLAVHSSVPANTFQELVALVKSKPGEMTYGSSGIGSTHHLCMEFMKASLGLQITHVPFKGTGQSVPALVGGQVPMLFSAYPSLAAYAKDGRVKILAANSSKRAVFAQNIPTIAETIPGFDFAPTVGIFAPRGTAKELINKINADALDAVKQPDTATRMLAVGVDAEAMTPEEYAASLRADAERYSRAVKLSGARAD